MIVSGGVKVRSKSNRERAARADQLLLTKLKTAVANGTLRDLLWRPVVVNKVKSSASMTLSPPSKQQQREDKRPSTKQRRSAERDPSDYEYGDVEPFDEIRIWNELLTARVLKKRRNRFVFSNDTVTGSWRTLSNIFESSVREDAVDDSLFNSCELSHSDDVYGQQAPPLIPIKPPDTAASSALDVSRPVSSDEFTGRGQTFVTLDVGVETETVQQTAQPQPAVKTRSWTRRNGVLLSEADHARIMLEFQQRKALPSVGSSGRGTLVVVADSLRGMDLVFNTNDPMSVESDTEGIEMTDELDDDDINQPALDAVTVPPEDCQRLKDTLRQSLPALVSEAATKKDSRRGEARGPVPSDEMESLLADGVVSLEYALLMEDNPVKGNSEAMAARDRQRVDRRSRRGGFVGNFAEPLYEKLALIHDQNYSEVKEMHWAGVKSEKYLQFSDSHPGTATTDRSSTGYSGAEMAINDLQDILRASNELRHEREKFVGSRNRKLYELDEAAQKAEDLKVWEKLQMVNSLLSDEYDSPDALEEICEEEDIAPTDDLHRDAVEERSGECTGVTEELDEAGSTDGSSIPPNRLVDGMASAICIFVAALMQSVVDQLIIDGSQRQPSDSNPPDAQKVAAGPEPPKKMDHVPFKRVRAKIELQQLTSTDPASIEAETPPVDTTIDSIPSAVSYSSSKTLLLRFSVSSKRGIMNKVDTKRKSVLSTRFTGSRVLATGSTGSRVLATGSTGSSMEQGSIRDIDVDSSSNSPHSSPSALVVENFQQGTRTRRMNTLLRKSRLKRVSGSSSNSSSKDKGLFADKSISYGKKAVSSQRAVVSLDHTNDEEKDDEEEEDTDSMQSSVIDKWSSRDEMETSAAIDVQSAFMVKRHDDGENTMDYQPSSSFDDEDEDEDSSSNEFYDSSFSSDEDGQLLTSKHVLLGDRNVDGYEGTADPDPDSPSDTIIPVVESVSTPPVSGSRKVDLVNQDQIRITSTAAGRSLPSTVTIVDMLAADTITPVEVHAKDDTRRRVRSRTGGVVEQMLSRVQMAAIAQAQRHRSKVSASSLRKSHFQKYHIPFISQPSNGRPSASQSDNPLAGIWPYDSSLAAFNALLSLVKMRQTSGYARKRVWLKKENSDRRKTVMQRMPYPLKYYNSDSGFQEVSFDPASNCLTFSSCSVGGRLLLPQVSVDIKHIFVSLSSFVDMVTLRTNQLHLVPSGYLGSFRVSSWRSIKAELHSSLIHYRHHKADQAQQRVERDEDSIIAESLSLSATSVTAAAGRLQFDDSVELSSLPLEGSTAFVTQPATAPGREEASSQDEIGLLQRYAERGYAFYKRLSDVSRSNNTDLRGLHDLAYDNLSKLNFIITKHYYYRSALSSPSIDQHHRTPIGGTSTQGKRVPDLKTKSRTDSSQTATADPRLVSDDTMSGVVSVIGTRPSDRVTMKESPHMMSPSSEMGAGAGSATDSSLKHASKTTQIVTPLEPHSPLSHLQRRMPTAPSDPRPTQTIDRQSIALRQRVFVQPIDATDQEGLESNDGIRYLSANSQVELQSVSESTPQNSVVGNNNIKVGKRVVFLLDEATAAGSDDNVSGARMEATTSMHQFDDSILCDDSTELLTSATSNDGVSTHSIERRQQFSEVLLLESRKTAADVFIQKFWQLKMAVTACQTPYSCHEALLHNPDRYGLVLLSQRDLSLHGLQESLHLATPSGTYRSHCSVVVHGVAGVMSDADLLVLKEFGVDGVLSEPFSLKALKTFIKLRRRAATRL